MTVTEGILEHGSAHRGVLSVKYRDARTDPLESHVADDSLKHGVLHACK